MPGILRLISAMLLAALMALPLSAQDRQQALDYETWNAVALRAETAVENARASSAVLEVLRIEIADWRARFLKEQLKDQERIATLRSQLEVLGPVPEDGIEAEEIAARRVELQEQLSRLRAPILRAEEAYKRANGIVGEIDGIIRERQTDALLALGPSPLDPTRWPSAIDALVSSARSVWKEVVTNWNSNSHRTTFRQNLPLVLFLLALAAFLVIRGRTWVLGFVRAMRGATRPGTGVWTFFLSLGQIVLPLGGLIALSAAIEATALLGLRGQLLLDKLPFWGAQIIVLRWLADQIFARSDDFALVQLDATRRTEAKFYVNILAVIVVARSVIEELMSFGRATDPAMPVLQFPLFALAGLLLFRIGQMLLTSSVIDTPSTEERPQQSDGRVFRLGLIRLLSRILILLAIVGPVMAAIGYAGAGSALIIPAIWTMALCGVMVILLRFISDLYYLITRERASEGDSLIPVLLGFVVIIAALPVLGLIWGARVADLTELWSRFLNGFQLGETRISPTDFLTFTAVFVIGYSVTRLLQGGLRSSVLPRTKIDSGGQTAIVAGAGYVGIFLSALIAVSSAGLDLSSVAIVAGALSVGIGFGLQTIVSNFVSGIILLIERPISEGDWIEVNGTHGTVRDISVRSTRIETFDRYDVIIPNADLVSGTVSNYTRGNVTGRIVIPVGVAYGSDTRKVERILRNIARSHDMIMSNPEPAVDFVGFGADSLDFRIRAVLWDIGNGLSVRTELRHQIVERFAEEGIEIPFAQRDVWLRNPEALRSPSAPSEET
ncbi:MAG: DUF3772 domain-containing protein [Rhodobacteraceae bacterium]|nr:DUF3772 domain-containing protein [Paracoccaceae bacterium]